MARTIDDELRQMLKEEADEMLQESMMDAGFGTLHNELMKALKDRCKVTNVVKGMLGKDKFDIISNIDGEGKIKVVVSATGSGCEVIGKNDMGGLIHWRNVSLSRAKDRILEIFNNPKEVFAENADVTMFDGLFSYMEAAGDDDSDEDDGESLEDIEKDMDGMDSDDEGTDDNEDDELGKDDSDVQNEYDEEELTILNKLIADEQEAIQGYFDAAEKSKQDVLIRLYSDIGKEERFHTEQLLYAKAELTGEKYEPSDPEVKKEYEELLEGGMDEETAMYTIADKHKLDAEDNEELDEDLEDIEKDIESLGESFALTMAGLDLMMAVQESTAYKNHKELNEAYCEYFQCAEETMFMEAMDNVATKQGSEILGTNNPFLIIGRAIKTIYNAILNLVRQIKNWVDKRRIKSKRVAAWIKKHGIKGLFQDGVKLYFWNDQNNQVEVSDAVAYLTLLMNATTMVANKLGIRGPKYKSDISGWAPKAPAKVPVITTPNDAMSKISGVVFSKSKLIVNDSNATQIENMFFGISDEVMRSTTVDETTGAKTQNVKNINIYNALTGILDVAGEYAKATDVWMGEVQNVVFKPGNNPATKNPTMFRECISLMKEVSKGYQRLIKCINADISTCMKLDQGLLAAVQQGEKSLSDLSTAKQNDKLTGKELSAANYGDNAYNINSDGTASLRKTDDLH